MRWPIVSLGELVEICGGGTPDKSNPEYWGGDIPWASVKDFKAAVITSTLDKITTLGVERSATRIVPRGSILVPTRMAVGKVAIAGIDLAINQDLKALWPSPDVDARYLFRAIEAFGPTLEREATGATVKGIKLGTLRALPIPLAPPDEQKRIAAILDKVDDLRRARCRALTRLDDLTQSIYFDMFGDTKPDWPSAEVGEVAMSMRTGPFGSQLLHSEFTDEGVAVLGIDNAVSNRFQWGKSRYISENKYQQLKRYTVQPGDVLITIMGTCGRCAIVPDGIPTAINTKHLCAITLDTSRVRPTYLHATFLRHPNVLRQLGVQAKGAVMPGLNMGIIKGLKIPVPPIEVQREFERRSEAVESLLRLTERASAESDLLFSSLQQRAFRGDL